MQQSANSSGKRVYKSPQLVIYGDVRKITQTVFLGTGNGDGQGVAFKTMA